MKPKPADEPVEQIGNCVRFPKSWTWAQIFLWIAARNRDVDCWKQTPDGRRECHLKVIQVK